MTFRCDILKIQLSPTLQLIGNKGTAFSDNSSATAFIDLNNDFAYFAIEKGFVVDNPHEVAIYRVKLLDFTISRFDLLSTEKEISGVVPDVDNGIVTFFYRQNGDDNLLQFRSDRSG
jgi:hypothetical protein